MLTKTSIKVGPNSLGIHCYIASCNGIGVYGKEGDPTKSGQVNIGIGTFLYDQDEQTTAIDREINQTTEHRPVYCTTSQYSLHIDDGHWEGIQNRNITLCMYTSIRSR